MVINYININYTEKNSKKQLVNDSKIENIFTKYSNYDKFLFFKEFRKDINYKNLGSSLLVQPFYGNSNNYIFNTLYDGLYSSASNRYESLNKMKLNEIKCKINVMNLAIKIKNSIIKLRRKKNLLNRKKKKFL